MDQVPEFKEGSHGLTGSRCSSRHDALSNVISLSTRSGLGEARRGCVDGVPTSMTSSLGKARLGARRSKVFSSLALDQIRWGCVSNLHGLARWGRRDVVEAAGRTCGLTRMKDVAPWT